MGEGRKCIISIGVSVVEGYLHGVRRVGWMIYEAHGRARGLQKGKECYG